MARQCSTTHGGDMRYKYAVYYPNSATLVATFKTLKAAKALCDALVEDQTFEPVTHIPCIKRHPLLKGNTTCKQSV